MQTTNTSNFEETLSTYICSKKFSLLIYLDRLFFSLESGPGAYESGIMVSKAVEIYIQGKLLKPAGEHACCMCECDQQ